MPTYRRHHRKNSWRTPIIIVLGLTMAAAFYGYSRYEYLINTPVNSNALDQQVNFKIGKGDNSRTIVSKLAESELILDSFSLSIYLRFHNLDRNLKSGIYQISPSQTPLEILATLQSGKPSQNVLTIPEGYTVYQIDQLLVENGLIQAGEFNTAVQNYTVPKDFPYLDPQKIKSLPHALEGYLFPDTYFVSSDNFQPENLIQMMLQNFDQKMKEYQADVEKTGRSWSEIVNVAAMVEEEANRNQDRPLIAGIIWKRLDEKWTLGIDATLLYQANDREISQKDLQKDGPYNTRKNAGLPPGPIASPGLASLKAAINPEKSDYYFYLTSKDGDMIYAKTNSEHNQNKEKYL